MKPKAKTNLEKMGFLDLDRNKNHDELQLEILSNPEKLVRSISKSELKNLKIKSVDLEVPVVSQSGYNSSKFIVGYLDCVIIAKFDGGYAHLAIEIKTKIDSFGDTLRQINTYKQYKKDFIYCIASQDDKYKEQFETQGLRFYNFKI